MTETTPPRVGFVGLGTMGLPMAKRVVGGGFPLAAYDVRAEPVDALVQLGARAATSPREAGDGADVVITMLPDSPDVERAVLGPDGVLEGLRPGAVLIEMSTIDPAMTKRVARAVQEKGAQMLDAPVGRSSAAAVQGELIIMVGGEADLLERCRPILARMGTTIHHCGPLGAGATIKVINNLVSSSILTAVAEGMVLGVKAGLDPDLIVDVLSGTAAGCWQLENVFRNKVMQGDFAPGFKASLAFKDLGLAQALARDNGVPLFVGSLARQLYELTRAQGKGDQDWGAYTAVLEELAGITVRSKDVAPAAGPG
jgi:4-hydroxybutyrate dehydrogenase/sulfolactaldehyde 3-reductase